MRKVAALLLGPFGFFGPLGIIVSFVLHTLCSPAVSAERSKEGTAYIAIVPFYTPESIWRAYTPLINYLNKSTGMKWELKLVDSHDDVVRGLCAGEIDIALLGPVPYSRAHEQCGAKPLLAAVSGDGTPFYRSVIVTADPAIKTLGEVRGKRFGFLKNSTASYVLPRKLLDDEGITLDMIQPVYYQSQDRIVEGLLKNEIDAGGIKEALYKKFKKFNLKRLKASEPLPNFVFCAAPQLRPQVAEAFTTALLRLKPRASAADKKLMREWDDEIKNGFIKPPETFFSDILRMRELSRRYRP